MTSDNTNTTDSKLAKFDDKDLELNAEELRQTLNIESGKCGWKEIQVQFARGMVVVIDPSLDLIDVSEKFVKDDKDSIEKWMNDTKIWRSTDEDAKAWVDSDPTFWAVVVPPWVLVQNILD